MFEQFNQEAEGRLGKGGHRSIYRS
jgi:hypothetical protein